MQAHGQQDAVAARLAGAYRTAENRIEGAVLQLLDVNEIKRSLEQTRNAGDFAEAIIDTVREPLAVLHQDLRIETVNRSMLH